MKTLPERVRLITLGTPAEPILRSWRDTLSTAASVDAVLQRARTSRTVQMDTVTVPLEASSGSASVYRAALTIEKGGLAGPVQAGDQSLLLIRRDTLPARPMTFEEARSQVVQDYQDSLEARTHAKLRKRYRAELYPRRLQNAFMPDR